MFKIEELNPNIEAKTFKLSDRLFHEALKEEPESMARFHVTNDKGEDFDIVYWDNNDDLEPRGRVPRYVKPPFICPYRLYDETDTGTLFLDFLNPFEAMMFEELNEYTVALTRVILANTGMDVWCRDAYRMADAIDPAALAAGMTGGKTFSPPEFTSGEMLGSRPDCRAYCLSVPSSELMAYARSVGGSPVSVLSVALSRAVQKVHPENTLPIKIMYPVDIRKVMGNRTSLVHQAVFAQYKFEPSDVAGRNDRELNAAFRDYLRQFTSAPSIRMNAGIFRSMCEGYTKAFAYGALDKICMEQRKSADASLEISYLGTLHTGDYGSRIRMTAFHVMPENGIMLQVTEIGGTFFIDWYQGMHEAAYVKAMRDVLAGAGMKDLRIERVE